MKKHFWKLFIIFVFFLSPMIVKANFGDLRYEITDVEIYNSNITFKGWAFIHRTNNYINVKDLDGNIITNEEGGQKVIMQAFVDDELLATKISNVEEDRMLNYNFYCELFYKGNGHGCGENSNGYEDYISLSYNSCNTSTTDYNSQCYYEDMYFEITFDVSEWNISDSSKVRFKIAVSNNFFEDTYDIRGYSGGFWYEDDYYTNLENVSVSDASISNYSNDYIAIDKVDISSTVEFIASSGILINPYNVSLPFTYSVDGTDTIAFGSWKDGSYGAYYRCGNTNIYELISSDSYPGGRSLIPSEDRCRSFFGADCKGTYYYAIKVKDTYTTSGYINVIACPASGDNYLMALARGSHIKTFGYTVFQITIKNRNLCEVDEPYDNSNKLECNSSKTLNSECEELTVTTSEGSANVKIEQTGNISSVLTPNTTYAGCGFNFGIMYYSTIKWSYVSGQDISSSLHKAVTSEMNKKIKNYNDYVAGLNIDNLKLGGKSFGMIKQCTTSNINKDYYNKDLTVSCLFTFPKATVGLDGSVNYNYDDSYVDINNKYYTPINYNGSFEIQANIVGMDRITSSAAKRDSEVDGKTWTGTWEDTFYNCSVNIYSLLMNTSGNYNFIYRPIDITNPFPSRNAGINWFDWYNVNRNKERLENTYSNLQYTVTLNNQAITAIKNYNSGTNYLSWDGIYWDRVDESYYSEFIDNYDYVDRVGDN